MDMKAASNKKTKRSPSKPAIDVKKGFTRFVIERGKKPNSVYKFCKSIGIQEDDFYKQFGSLQALEKTIWKDYVSDTVVRLKADENYASFDAREKILSFYFTMLEVVKPDREYITWRIRKWKLAAFHPGWLNKFKKAFDEWSNEVIEEGKRNGEIASRPFLDKRYGSLLWFHLNFILHFWSRDSSADFEKTDVAIEKSVNLAFDLIGKGLLDNAFDFGKFLFHQARD